MLIKFSEEDIQRTLPVEAGAVLFEVTKYEEKNRPEKKDTEMKFDLKVVSHKNGDDKQKSRIFTAYFYTSAIGFFLPFVSALLDTPVDNLKNVEIDPDKFIGKMLIGLVVDDVYNGKPQKRCNEWASAAKVPW